MAMKGNDTCGAARLGARARAQLRRKLPPCSLVRTSKSFSSRPCDMCGIRSSIRASAVPSMAWYT